MWWLRKGLTPASGEDSVWTNENVACASESLCLSWSVAVKAGVSH